jgi:hypothetical protein
MRRLQSFAGNDGGNVAIITALSLLTVGMVVGGGIDMSRLSASGSKLQDAADAAALAIASTVGKAPPTIQTATLEAEARRTAAGFAAPAFKETMSVFGGGVVVELQSRTPAQVKVTLSQAQDTFLGGLLGIKSLPLHRTAVAVSRAAYPVCLLVLDPDAGDAWSAQGTSDVVGPQCVAQVNSESSRGLDANGNAGVRMLRTFVAGPKQSVRGFSPTPYFDQPPLEDPLAPGIEWPAPATCQTLQQFKNETRTLAPGSYCGGLDLATGAVVRLQPGVYVIKTGSVALQSGAVLDGSAGVTLVLLDPNGTVSMQAGAALKIAASKTGDWASMALAIKPQPSERTSSLGGGGELELDGIVYAPTQYVRLTGGGQIQRVDAPRTFVVNRLATQGNGLIYLRGSSALMMGSDTRLVK